MGRARPDILKLVGQLHEGLADEDLWIRAVDSMCALLGVRGLLLGTVDGGGRTVHFELARNAGQESISLLEGPLNDPRHNPWIGVARDHPLRHIGTMEAVGGQQALERTRMWSEFYQPLGLRDTLGAVLERQPEYSQVLIMARQTAQPDFATADRQALGAIVPHLARAWRVKRQLAEWKTKAGTLKYVLDRLDRAIVVTGPEGDIRFANRAADRLLSRGHGLDATRGRIRATRPRDTDALRLLIDQATRTGVGAGHTAVDAVAIRCREDGLPLAVVAEPLAATHGGSLGHEPSPGAVLFIGETEASSRPPVNRLRVVYGLTPAEARLTSLVVEGHDISSAARAACISENTVKYHLKSIFGKVGVSRQTQLVRRVLADVGGLAEPEKMLPAASATRGSERVSQHSAFAPLPSSASVPDPD